MLKAVNGRKAGGRLGVLPLQIKIGSELGNRWRFERLSDRQFDVEAVADPRDQLDGPQRMTADVKEIVVNADALDVQKLQPDLRQRALRCRTGCDVLLFAEKALRGWQRLAVD